MAYIGRPSIVGNFVKLDAISVVNGQAAYTMQNGSANFTDYSTVNQFLVSLNGTIQSPGSSFTVSGSTITFSSNLVTNDVIDFIIVFGNSLSSGVPTDATVSTAKIVDANVTTAKLADDSVTAAKINNDIISGSTELASEPADTDEFLVSDAGTLKRIDYSLIKSTPGLNLIKEVTASDVASVSFVHGTSDVVFDTTYKLYFFTFVDVNMAGDEEIFIRPLLGGSAQTSGFLNAQAGNYSNTGGAGTYSDYYTNAFAASSGDAEQDTPVSGYAYFVNAGGSSKKPQSFGQFTHERSNANFYNISFSCTYDTAVSNFNGFTFTNNGGPNITSGNFKLYGLK